MDIYQPIKGIVLAKQVTKERLISGAIRNIDKETIIITTQYALVETVEGNIKALPGDWIVKFHDDQDYMVFSNSVFKKLYTKF